MLFGKKNLVKSSLAILLITNNVLAGTCDLPVKVKQGDSVPCNGYVFSDLNEEKIRTDLIYKQSLIDNLTKQNSLQASIIKIDQDQIEHYQDKANQDASVSDFQKALYFGLGVAATALAAYGTIRVLK